MTKDEYIEKVNDIRLRMCKDVAFVTAAYLKQYVTITMYLLYK